MKDLDITALQNECRERRHQCHQTNLESHWVQFRYIRNKLKTVIKTTKKLFHRKALQSKRPKDVWNVIHRILHPNKKRVTFDPNSLNQYFVTMAENLTGKKPTSQENLYQLIEDLPPSNNNTNFCIEKATYHQVLREIKSLRNDCSTGFDQIPINILKLVAESIASPLTHIINESIKKSVFPEQWKIAKICPIPKIDQPK
jgi:hypothetical protein